MLHARINVPPVPAALEALAEGLVQLNVWFFEQAAEHGVEMPDLYDTDVVYRREPPGREWWENAVDVRGVVSNRSGDCEDLSGYVAAWLRVFEDDHASVRVVPTRAGKFHAIVEHEDGTLEDPSRVLVRMERARQRRRH
jgi:hypothetical protein